MRNCGRRLYELKNDKGLSAAVYTQLTDVETEGNGLLTYDRAVIKPDLARAAAAVQGDFSRVPQEVVIVPTSQEQPQTWRYTFDKPADDWFKPEFGDGDWKQGPGGFGHGDVHGAPSARNGRRTTSGFAARRRCRITPFPTLI